MDTETIEDNRVHLEVFSFLLKQFQNIKILYNY